MIYCNVKCVVQCAFSIFQMQKPLLVVNILIFDEIYCNILKHPNLVKGKEADSRHGSASSQAGGGGIEARRQPLGITTECCPRRGIAHKELQVIAINLAKGNRLIPGNGSGIYQVNKEPLSKYG